jgi:hypothetical protein
LPQQILRHLYSIDDYAIGTHEAKRAPNSDILGRATQLSRRPAASAAVIDAAAPRAAVGNGATRRAVHTKNKQIARLTTAVVLAAIAIVLCAYAITRWQ